MVSWFPKFNAVPTTVNTNSFYDQVKYNNPKYVIIDEFVDNSFLTTYKLKIYPNQLQIDIIKSWFLLVIQVYNKTNEYIKNTICIPEYILDKKTNIISIRYTFVKDEQLIKKTLNFIRMRDEIMDDYIKNLKNNSTVYRHTLDYGVKLCVEMYKSLKSNYKAGNIKHFNVKDFKENRRRLNLVLEPVNFSDDYNSFAHKHLKLMKSQKPFNSFELKHNMILQHDQFKKTWFLLIPMDKTFKSHIFKEGKC
jgi:hypothetical protein